MPKLVIDTAENSASGTTTPDIVKQRALIARKLVRANPDDTSSNYKPDGGMSKALLNKVAMTVASNIRDNRTIMELLPDTKAIFTLMVSTIKSPNTLIGSKLRFEDIEKPSGVSWEGSPTEIIEDWLTDVYEFDSKLSDILWDCLCWKGSYPILVLPETAIDNIINGKPTLAGEDFTGKGTYKPLLPFNLNGNLVQKEIKNIGIINDAAITAAVQTPDTKSLPSIKTVSGLFEEVIKETIVFSDNIDIFKRPKIQKEFAMRNMAKSTNSYFEKDGAMVTNEDRKGNKLRPTDIFGARRFKENDLLTLTGTNPEDKSFGTGIIVDLPPESVIPINDLVYAVLLDGVGNPLCMDNYTSEYESLKKGINFGDDTGLGGNLIKNVSDTYKGTVDAKELEGDYTAKALNEDYGKIFDRIIMDVLTGSDILGDADSFVLPDMEQIHTIGVMRALRGMHTTILIVPSHLITYFHYSKNNLGVGESLLTQNRFLASQRITIRLANQLTRITNSIPRREVLINIDEDEKEPAQIAEMMKTACIDDFQSEFSVGKIDSRDIITGFVKANTVVRAVHKDLPTHHMEVKDFVRSVTEVDSKLEEELRGDWAKALDTQPELVDEFFKPEFAVEHITRNTMYTKSTIEKQHKFEPQITRHVKQLCYYYPQLYNLLLTKLAIKPGSHSEHDVLEYIIESISIKLPRPEQAELDSTFKGFKEVSSFITAAIESIVDEDMLYRVMDKELVNTDGLKAVRMQLEMLCRREWLTDGTVTIVRRLLDSSEDEAPAIDITALLNEHNDNVIKNLGDMVKTVMERTSDTNQMLESTREKLEQDIARLKEEKAAAEAEANPTPEPPVDESGSDVVDDGSSTPPDDTVEEETEFDETVDETTEPPVDEEIPPEEEEEIEEEDWDFGSPS